MKKLILMTALFSLILTAITILKYESSKLDIKIEEAIDLKNKLKYDLSFLQAEWEYLSSPKNIEKLSKTHLDFTQVSLISIEEFLIILKSLRDLE